MKVKIRAGLNNILPGRCFSATDLVGNKSYYVVIGKKDGCYNYMPSYNVVQVLPHKNGLRYFNISDDLCIWRFFDQTLAKKEAKKLFNAIILSNVLRDFDYRDLHFCKKEVKMNGESYELLNFPFIEHPNKLNLWDTTNRDEVYVSNKYKKIHKNVRDEE